jgi:RimJ/RimL family protein N-acetyltransferase
MIVELEKCDFHKCFGMLNEQGQVEAKAVVAGVNPGRIFVDHIESPTSGLIWLGNNDGFIFIGDERNERFNEGMNSFIDSVIAPDAGRAGINWFEGVGNHPKWEGVIERLFAHRNLGSWLQHVYIMPEEKYNLEMEPILEQGYAVHKITEALYENKDNSIRNIDFLHATIDWSWSSSNHFFSNGIGYCIVYENEIVCICSSSFEFEHVQCIGIETVKAHQGKKLAQTVAHRFVKECIEKGWMPYWDCMDVNKPSSAVAERLGFARVFTYTGYEFSF